MTTEQVVLLDLAYRVELLCQLFHGVPMPTAKRRARRAMQLTRTRIGG